MKRLTEAQLFLAKRGYMDASDGLPPQSREKMYLAGYISCPHRRYAKGKLAVPSKRRPRKSYTHKKKPW